MARVIFDPPAAPIPSKKSPFLSVIMDGHIEDSGRLPGSIKFDGEDGKPKELMTPGVEKSSISLFKIIPVLGDTKPQPKLKGKQIRYGTRFIKSYE